MSKDYSFPAFPSQPLGATGMPLHEATVGMSLRDYFAANADRDEISEITSRSLSLSAKERLVGRPSPDRPDDRCSREDRVAYQLAVFDFEAELDCILRFKMADAMLIAREA